MPTRPENKHRFMTRVLRYYFALRRAVPSYPPGLAWELAVLRMTGRRA